MGVEDLTQAAALQWFAEGRRVVESLLVEVLGSAPLDLGATMLVDGENHIEGSVTGGCVEGALVEESHRVLSGGEPRVRTFGISDDVAGEVGLMCGGTVRILTAELGEENARVLGEAFEAIRDGRPVAIATLLDGPGTGRKLALIDGEVRGGFRVTDLLDRSVTRDAGGLLEQGISMIRRYSSDGATMGDEIRVFVQSFATAPRMIVFGAIDFSAAIAPIARELGYAVTICDARKPFLESNRFSRAAEIVADWPDRYLATQTLTERDVVLVFTHDAKFDEPALIAALRTGAGYIGALGSRRTQEDRARRLRDAGVTPEQLDRIVGPCGLDIGAATPMETAVSILGEIIARRSQRPGTPLTETSGTIRARPELHVA